jgi:hypothetical protein
MELSPSWEAASCAVNSRILQNPKVYYRVHKSLLSHPWFLVHLPNFLFCDVSFNYIISCTLFYHCKNCSYACCLSVLKFDVVIWCLQLVPHGSVATDNPRCSVVGTEILKNGGNAVDAAVASTLCLGVVNPHVTGLGGWVWTNMSASALQSCFWYTLGWYYGI